MKENQEVNISFSLSHNSSEVKKKEKSLTGPHHGLYIKDGHTFKV